MNKSTKKFSKAPAVIIATMMILQLVGMSAPKARAADTFEKGMVSLTFDDGAKSVYNNIGLLGSFKSTQYINTIDLLGATLYDPEFYPQYMTKTNLRTLYNSGHEIADHSRTHPDLSLVEADQTKLLFEIDGSRSDLLEAIGVPVSTFAYPFGVVAAKDKLKSAGFSGARTVSPGVNTKSTDRYALYAHQVNSDTAIETVQGWIEEAVLYNKWLILIFHSVDENCSNPGGISGDTYCVTPSNLSAIVSYLQGKGSAVDVVKVSEGLARMDNSPVSDAIAPVIAQENLTVEATSSAGAAVAFSPAVTDSDAGLPFTPLSAFCTIPTEVEFGDSGVKFKTVVTSGYTFPIGVSTVTCTAADAGGHLGTKPSFTVTVADSIPMVSLKKTSSDPTKSSPIPVVATFSEPVTGFDLSDIVVTNASKSDFAGSGAVYTFNVVPIADGAVTVNIPAGVAQDTALNFNTVATELSVTFDGTLPVITLLGANPQTVALGAGYTELGATADDGSLVTIDATAFVDAVGTYLVTYDAIDAVGNQAVRVTRTVDVVDMDAPIIDPHADATAEATSSAGATVTYTSPKTTDSVDGEGVASCAPASGSTFALGETTVTCTASDSVGNEATPTTFKVVVTDKTAPVIAIHGANPVSLTVGDAYADAGATASDNADASVDVKTAGSVDTAVPGEYLITYTATDNAGNKATAVSRTVRVNAAPSIAPPVESSEVESEDTSVTTNTPTLSYSISKKAKKNITFMFSNLTLSKKKYVKVRLNGRKTTVARIKRSGNDTLVTVALKFRNWPVGNYNLEMSYKNQIKVPYLTKKGKTKYRKGWESGNVNSENILEII